MSLRQRRHQALEARISEQVAPDRKDDGTPTRRRGAGQEVDEVRSGGPLVILFSSDLEASVRAVVAAGGTITTEPFTFPGGRRFHFTDPSGNELAVWGDPRPLDEGE